jgi:predicted nuclease of predicted toxin-antitoxin system
MRLLADENFPRVAVDALRLDGHDVLWIRLLAPGISDEEVLARALADDRVLLTFDRDFGELVFISGAEAGRGIVLFRITLPSPDEVARLIVLSLRTRTDWEDHFSVVEPGRIRMRDLPRGSRVGK